MIKDKLKEIRENTHMNKKEFAAFIGIKYTTYNNYEMGEREPNSDFLILISKKFDVSIDYILGLQDEKDIKHSYELKSSEYERIKKYRFITEYSPDGANVIDTVLDREYSIADRLKEQAELAKKMNIKTTEEIIPVRIISYHQKIASAGDGQIVFDDMAVDRIKIPDIPKYKRVSYAIGVNGQSMEPLYYDGDILLIEPTCQIEVGEIGIFIVDGKAYVKKLGDGELISLNKGYENIALTEYSNCMGRVVDKLQKD